jgi:branched-subunit amino acid aminotransferase/4-amino-4-deoxychorismate lyase
LARALRLAAAALRRQLGAGGDAVDLKLTVLLLLDARATAAALADPALRPPPGEDEGAAAERALVELAARRPRSLLIAHATPLAPRRAPPIKVLAAGAPRSNAAAKDSAWVAARVALEAAKPSDCEEVLLVEAAEDGGGGGAVLEGTQTNFFAVVRGVLRTAGEERVLAGTVRRLVLEVCAREGIPVELEAPRLAGLRADGEAAAGDAAEDWEACFLSSTSRLVLPVDEVEWTRPGGGARARRSFAPHPLVARVEALVAADVAAHCSDVLGGSEA